MILGILLIILGFKNYKTSKKDYETKYFRIGFGLEFIIIALLRFFIGTNIIWLLLLGIGTFIFITALTYVKKRKYNL